MEILKKLEFVKCPYINKCFNLFWVFYVLSRSSKKKNCDSVAKPLFFSP